MLVATDAFGNALGSSLARVNLGDSDDMLETAPGVLQTNSAADFKALGYPRLPAGTRLFVNSLDSDIDGIVANDSTSGGNNANSIGNKI
ncbi:MAG: hypothetical protein K2X55_19430 [Burkholderiaceae bacterium]|nr:hypothetical protein [Burkholderiaceae bacterium]